MQETINTRISNTTKGREDHLDSSQEIITTKKKVTKICFRKDF